MSHDENKHNDPERRGGEPLSCEQVRMEIQDSWGLETSPLVVHEESVSEQAQEHIEGCSICKDEVESLAHVESLLHEAFRKIDAQTAPPGEDRIASVVREVQVHPDVSLLRRTRRSVRTLLWFGFFTVSLLLFLALILAALRAMN